MLINCGPYLLDKCFAFAEIVLFPVIFVVRFHHNLAWYHELLHATFLSVQFFRSYVRYFECIRLVYDTRQILIGSFTVPDRSLLLHVVSD